MKNVLPCFVMGNRLICGSLFLLKCAFLLLFVVFVVKSSTAGSYEDKGLKTHILAVRKTNPSYFAFDITI